MWSLRITDALLHGFNLVFNMAIGDEDVLPSIVVVVKKETAKTKRQQRRASNFRARSFIHEQSIAFVVIERKHLVRKIRNDQTRIARAIVIGRIDAHSS